jgi:hypothetical protein
MNDAITPPAMAVLSHHPDGGWRITGWAVESPGVDRDALNGACNELLEVTGYDVAVVVWHYNGFALHGHLMWRSLDCQPPDDRQRIALEIVERIANMLGAALVEQWEAADRANA